MGNLGWSEMFFIVVFALIIFGPRRLPDIAKTLGRTMAQLRRASEEFKHTWEAEVERAELKEINQEIQEATAISEEQLEHEQDTNEVAANASDAGIIGAPFINPVSESVAKSPSHKPATEADAIDSKPNSQMSSADEHPVSIA